MNVAFIKKHIFCFQIVVFVISLALFGFIGVITFQTLVYDPPFRSDDTKIAIHKRANGEYFLELWRTLHVKEPPKSAIVSRYIKNRTTGDIVDWGATDREFTEEVNPVHRHYSMGHNIAKGEWCFTVILKYTPPFSIIEHRYPTTGICTNVTE